MTIKPIGTFAEKAYSAVVCFLVRGFVTLLATSYIYTTAIIFSGCSGDWNSYCVGFLFIAPFFVAFGRITNEDGLNPYDFHIFTVLLLTLIVTVLWTALALIRRRRAS